MKNALALFVLLSISSFISAEGEYDFSDKTTASKEDVSNEYNYMEIDGLKYLIIDEAHLSRFKFDWAKGNIARGDNLYIRGKVYQIYNGTWIGIGNISLYGIWWDLEEFVDIKEGDNVIAYGIVKEASKSVGTGHISIKKIEKVK